MHRTSSFIPAQPPSTTSTDFTALLTGFAHVFTKPSFALFCHLMRSWITLPGTHTVTRMYHIADPEHRRAHDAYHRFVRVGQWSCTLLWKCLAVALVSTLLLEGDLVVYCDDTLFHRTGKRVEGAGLYRDACRSTVKKVVHSRGLSLVVMGIRVSLPWNGQCVALPIMVVPHVKNGTDTYLDLAQKMITMIAAWFPDRRIILCADGAYAPLVGRTDSAESVHIISRLRRNAALYDLPPNQVHPKKGRPKLKGKRLPRLSALADAVSSWQALSSDHHGKKKEVMLFSRNLLWYQVSKTRPLLLVISRDPSGHDGDAFFVCSDTTMDAAEIIRIYRDRWSIEETFHNVKHYLHGEDPQCWKGKGPRRAASLSFFTYSCVWLWYLPSHHDKPHTLRILPWYHSKKHPAFSDILSQLRSQIWQERLYTGSAILPLPDKNTNALIEVLAYVA